MGRLFRRGELQDAVLEIIAEVGPAHGYAVLAVLAERIGGTWRPSPGAVYPTLLSLEDAGLVEGEQTGDTRQYRITRAGRRRLDTTGLVLARVTARADDRAPGRRLSAVLDDFVAEVPRRSRVLPPALADQAELVLDRARRDLNDLLSTPEQTPEEHAHG
jgi:DNA-binding PadR family transcriptional regulator